MASQTTYTRDELAAWTLRRLGGMVPYLGWTTETSFVQDALDQALSTLGVDDFPAVDGKRSQAVARVKIWEVFLEYLSTTPDVDLPDNIRIRYGDIYRRAVQMLAHATSAARRPRQTTIRYTDDPFSRY